MLGQVCSGGLGAGARGCWPCKRQGGVGAAVGGLVGATYVSAPVTTRGRVGQGARVAWVLGEPGAQVCRANTLVVFGAFASADVPGQAARKGGGVGQSSEVASFVEAPDAALAAVRAW